MTLLLLLIARWLLWSLGAWTAPRASYVQAHDMMLTDPSLPPSPPLVHKHITNRMDDLISCEGRGDSITRRRSSRTEEQGLQRSRASSGVVGSDGREGEVVDSLDRLMG